MMVPNDVLLALANIHRAARLLPRVVHAESEAFGLALGAPAVAHIPTLHDRHLDKVDAVHALVALLDIFERRHPAVAKAITLAR